MVRSVVSRGETPPRTWGRQLGAILGISHFGNTPTHVGKTARPPACRRHRRKHPHARGEDVRKVTYRDNPWETPPRTWGRRHVRREIPVEGGNTPTHVGKTCLCAAGLSPARKHPHARGEDKAFNRIVNRGSETPPRTWGRLLVAYRLIGGKRNTPTHVGKTKTGLNLCGCVEKHPHARGEDTSKTSL